MIHMNFFLPEPQVNALRKLSSKKDVSVAELVRRAIDAYLIKTVEEGPYTLKNKKELEDAS